MHGETAAAASFSRRLVKEKDAGRPLDPVIDDMNKLVKEYHDYSRPAYCAQHGLVDEVARLKQRPGLTADSVAMRTVGYRQVWAMLAGEYDFETMREKAVIATAQLAKRQMTWLRKEKECNFFDPKSVKLLNMLKNLRYLL